MLFVSLHFRSRNLLLKKTNREKARKRERERKRKRWELLGSHQTYRETEKTQSKRDRDNEGQTQTDRTDRQEKKRDTEGMERETAFRQTREKGRGR